MHVVEAQAGQLADAGIETTPLSELSWWQTDISRLGLPARYAVLLPGGAAHRPEKRWPAEFFAETAVRLAAAGETPVVVGGPPEVNEARIIQEACPACVSLIGQTSLLDLGSVMRGATLVVGNDTGPMHIAGLVGTPVVVLFGSDSDPALNRPRAPASARQPRILREKSLTDLSVSAVWQEISDILG